MREGKSRRLTLYPHHYGWIKSRCFQLVSCCQHWSCAFSGVRVWVVSEGLVSSHCIRSVALVTMATCVEIKQGIVSDSSGKCVLMWVWGNSIAWIVGFWVGEMPQTLNNNEKKKKASPSLPGISLRLLRLCARNTVSLLRRIHYAYRSTMKGTNSQLSAFKPSMRTHETAKTAQNMQRSAGNSPHLLSGFLARDSRCMLSCFKIDIIFLADVNILQSPFIRVTGKFSWKTLISMAILYCTSS